MTYKVRLVNKFHKRLQKYLKKDYVIGKEIEKVLITLSKNPFDTSLRSHKVYNHRYGTAYSSDVRVIWDFDGSDKAIILALEVGGHNDVYKA